VPGKPLFTLTNEERLKSHPKEAIPYDIVPPPEAPGVIGHLRDRFNSLNAPAMKQIRDAESACASGH
jgi:hypothetical protein